MRTVAGLVVAVALIAGCGSAKSDDSGDRIAFTSVRDRDGHIFVMNADGTEVRQLTDDDDGDDDPAWSPDGTRIAFTRFAFLNDFHGYDSEIFVMNAHGTEVRQLTDNDGRDDDPAWSPDGERIAFTSVRDGDGEIFVMNADGTEVRQLTDNDEGDKDPAWSPDGKHIAFTSFRDGNDPEIFVMNADGTQVRQLTDNDEGDEDPAWSPDGKRIAFTSVRDRKSIYADFHIFVMNADGTEVRQLADDNNVDLSPAWSPDGERIAFTSLRDGDYQVFVMNADGTDVYSTGQQGWNPSWVEAAAVPVTVPGTPTGLSIMAGTGRLTLSWATPSNGGSAITAVHIEISDDGGGTWTSFQAGAGTTSTTVTGIASGQVRSMRVSIENAVGVGLASEPLTATVN